jgi:hypothetical protein
MPVGGVQDRKVETFFRSALDLHQKPSNFATPIDTVTTSVTKAKGEFLASGEK